jgi:trigger factor
MNIEKKKLEKSQIEFSVELPYEEFKPFVEQGAQSLSKDLKIEGFRPGKAPLNIVKVKVGDMAILQEAAHLAINKLFAKILDEHLGDDEAIGQPTVDITKLAPENPLEFKIVMATIPSVELGSYKDLKVKRTQVEVDEKEVERTIEYLRESRAKEAAVDREVKDGDKIIANVEMFLDQVPLEGGQAKDTTIMVGKEYFVPGFDAKVVGAKKGETREFTLSYPKDFHQKNIAGKNVEFRVTVKEVFERDIPVLDDELAKMFGGKDLADLKETIKKDIESHKKFEADRKTEIDVLDKVLEGAKFGDIPELLLSNESEKMMMELEENVSRQGGNMDDYLKSLKKTKEQLVMDTLPEAMRRVKTALLIRQVAKTEKIEATETEVEDKKKALLEQYKGYAKVEERINDRGYGAYLKNSITNQKVIGKLVEWNVVDDGKDKKEADKK